MKEVDNSLLVEFQHRKLISQERNAHVFLDEIDSNTLQTRDRFDLLTYTIYSRLLEKKVKLPKAEKRLFDDVDKKLTHALGRYKDEVLKVFYQSNQELELSEDNSTLIYSTLR